MPLTQADTLRALVDAADGQRLALLTVRLPDPTGYGRIVRGGDGTGQRIVWARSSSASCSGLLTPATCTGSAMQCATTGTPSATAAKGCQ